MARTIGTLYRATAESAVEAYIDIAIRDLDSTTQYLHYVLTLGLVVWATSMFASYAVFGHHRPLSAVLVVGVILVANMAMTVQRPAPLHGPVQHRLAAPAHPLARLRRAIGVAASAHRRSGQHLVGLHAWRCRVHRGRRDGVVRADADGRVGAAGRGVGRRGGRPDQALPVASPGSSRPAARAVRSASHSGPNSQVQQQWTTSGDAGGHDPAQPDRQRRLLLASDDLRQDRPHRLGPDALDVGRHPGRRTDLRPARRRRRSRKVATASRSP